MSPNTKKKSRIEAFRKEREEGFDLDFGVRAKLPEYNALRDVNMRHYFENSSVQEHLWRTGQIDRSGRVIDLEKNKSKLQIIENEFKLAEKMEHRRQKDEADIRYGVKTKRLNDLDDARKMERVQRIKEDRKIQREIVTATKEALGLISSSPEKKKGLVSRSLSK